MDYFPYGTMRPGQDAFISLVKDEVAKGNNVIIEAPTGFGKTACVLSAVLPVAESQAKKIVYLCRTHKQMDRVIEELKLISQLQPVTGISLRGRREMCLSPLVLNNTQDSSSSMYVCRLLRRMKRCTHYNNTKEQEEHALAMEVRYSKGAVSSNDIKHACEDAAFCPYEIAKAVMGHTQVIACSYMYLFSPDIREGFLEGLGASLEDVIVILDEAHNLPDLAIDLGSSRLSENSLKNGVREAAEYNEREIAAFLEMVHQALLSLDAKYKLEKGDEARIMPTELLSYFFGSSSPFVKEKSIGELEELVDYMLKQGEEIQKAMLGKGRPPRSYIHSCASFLSNWISMRGRKDFCFLLVNYLTKAGTQGARLEIVDLDPRNITTQVLDSCHAAVAMSGTLSPLVAFADTVGLSNYKAKAFPTPFSQSNLIAIAARGVTTKGSHRGLDMYRKIASKAAEVVNNTPKNVGIFAPSYEVLEGVLSGGLKYIIDKPLYVESRQLTSAENDRMVRAFKAHGEKDGAVLLGVLGGRNAEGQDYPGDEMNAVVLLGIPYARPTARVKAQIDYYSHVFPNRGSYYGYYLPAHRKLNQGAGRAHRRLDDKAAIVYLDFRVLQPFVKKDIPLWIQRDLRPVNDVAGAVGTMVGAFFGPKPRKDI
jgi:DNA excision repair protein ERCC-2